MFLQHAFALQEYAERLEENGYSDLDDLLSAEPRDLEEMLRHIEAKPGRAATGAFDQENARSMIVV